MTLAFVLIILQGKRDGILSKLCTAYIVAGGSIKAKRKKTSLTKMAFSKKLKNTPWIFFREIFYNLVESYFQTPDNAEALQWMKQFNEVYIHDATTITLNKFFKDLFQAARFQAAKIFTLFSLKHPGIDPIVTGFIQPTFFPNVEMVKSLTGKRLSQVLKHIKGNWLDIEVTFSQSSQFSGMTLRLLGNLYEGKWRFYITNLFSPSLTPLIVYRLYALRWQIEVFYNTLKNTLGLKTIWLRTYNGILAESYVSFITYILTILAMHRTADELHVPFYELSFKYSYEATSSTLQKNLSKIFSNPDFDFDKFFKEVVRNVKRANKINTKYLKDKKRNTFEILPRAPTEVIQPSVYISSLYQHKVERRFEEIEILTTA